MNHKRNNPHFAYLTTTGKGKLYCQSVSANTVAKHGQPASSKYSWFYYPV